MVVFVRSVFVATLATVFAACISLTASAAETDVDPATKMAIQDIVTKQLDAFAHDDAQRAETFAAPSIKDRFPDPAKFFGMVKENYGALIHPKSTQFNEVASSPHGPLQKVTIVAADGSIWTAIYSFEQVDGAWRISGCGLQRLNGEQDI